MTTNGTDSPRGRRATWTAGLVVAAGAGVATAHGLYQVAAAARVPAPIAWLYPLITDGLALVAYAATARLRHGGRRYAAGIVVLAAGLSGLAQAVYLAGGIGATSAAPVGLRFGVGAWPAIAAALTAHLLHLISADPTPATDTSTTSVVQRPASNPPSNPTLSNPVFNDASNPIGQSRSTEPVQRDADARWTAWTPGWTPRRTKLRAGRRASARTPPHPATSKPTARCPRSPNSPSSPEPRAAPPGPSSKTSANAPKPARRQHQPRERNPPVTLQHARTQMTSHMTIQATQHSHPNTDQPRYQPSPTNEDRSTHLCITIRWIREPEQTRHRRRCDVDLDQVIG